MDWEEWEERERIAAAGRRQQDFSDLMDEMAGRENGRLKRFMLGDDDRTAEGREKKAQREFYSKLEQLLADPAYAAIYRSTFDALRNAEDLTQRALDRWQGKHTLAKEELKQTVDAAQRMPDGTRVFRAADGRVFTEDGRLVEGVERESIEWKPGAPGYEAFIEKREAERRARETLEEIQGYQVKVLGHARDRMQDQDNPPSAEEIAKHKERIEQEMPKAVKAEIDASAAPEIGRASAVLTAKPALN